MSGVLFAYPVAKNTCSRYILLKITVSYGFSDQILVFFFVLDSALLNSEQILTEVQYSNAVNWKQSSSIKAVVKRVAVACGVVECERLFRK